MDSIAVLVRFEGENRIPYQTQLYGYVELGTSPGTKEPCPPTQAIRHVSKCVFHI